MKTGTLVKQHIFTLEVGRETPEDVCRYGLIMPLEPWFLEGHKNADSYVKVLWNPCENFHVKRKKSYTEYCLREQIEVVSEQG